MTKDEKVILLWKVDGLDWILECEFLIKIWRSLYIFFLIAIAIKMIRAKEPNLAHEIIRNKIILYGREKFWELVSAGFS